uniref:Isoform 3 of Uncharacterized protein ZSWIM9 n=1 Tax=Mus musculus TaxID=10090 RepID=Q6DI92-3|nr:unnamed protein product [Mus musculus]
MVRPGGAAERQVERVSRGPRMELTEPLPSAAVQKEEQELLDRTFFSWAEFSRFFDKWCQQRLVVFSVKSSTRVARSPWANTPPLYRLIHVLKYSYVLLVCKDVRMPNKSTAWCVSLSCDPTGGGEQGVSQTASNPQV